MTAPSPKTVTQLLLRWGQGDEAALSQLMSLVHDELHRIAGRHMRSERRNHTLQPTALVNEAYLRLVDQKRARWQNRAQFLAVAARVMRRILVDHARGRQAGKRRISAEIPLQEGDLPTRQKPVDVLALDEALENLAAEDPRRSRVIELRVFGGLTIKETAKVLGVATSTVIDDYRAGKAWLLCEIEDSW